MNNTTLEQAIENTEAYKQLGTEEVYLWNDPYPWEYANEIKSGGSHRLDISTSVWVTADHPCGLRFRWSVDLEAQDANGKGHYEVDVATITATRLALGDTDIRIQYEEYLNECADAIEKRVQESMDYIGRELTAVALIRKALKK